MVKDRPPQPSQFGGVPRFVPRPSGAPSSSAAASNSASPSVPRPRASGLGLGQSGLGGKGLGKGQAFKRHRKVQRDTIRGITKGDIRRLARRGGIKRISGLIYDEIRSVLRSRLEVIMKDVVAIVEHRGGKTVSVQDVVFTLNRLGRPIYGFEPHMRMIGG
ncbi:histone-fold-containing protein [Clohesyomyces aquaticus]|uniref:Histone H4 n=1 Tax=Clohesyomyces aquaticus TaxID=1231657 RepID=A0A1Y2A2L7_9PLEO|nr:histone-fold-containing protein [Clohesyomyces aquaticus]